MDLSLSPQEIEEAQYVPMSEEAMCLEEARQALAAHPRVPEQGSGPYLLVVEDSWYCRATDAIVGSYAILRHRFPTREEASAYLAAKFPGDALEELYARIDGPAPAVEAPADEASVPF